MHPDYEQLMRMNGELRSALADLDSKYQKLRTAELTQSWIIGAMSGAVFMFVAVIALHAAR